MINMFIAFLLALAVTTPVEARMPHEKKLSTIKETTKTLYPVAKIRTGDVGARAFAHNKTSAPATKTVSPCVGQDFCCTVATAATNDDTASQNSEPAGDVGTTQFVYFGKQRIRSFDKATLAPDGVLDLDMNRLFSAGGFSVGSSDPCVIFDNDSKQWLLCGLSLNALTITLAVGDYNADSPGTITADTVWTFYVITGPQILNPTTTCDYQKMGVDNNAVYIGLNLFDEFDFNFESSAIVVFRKDASLLAGGPATINIFSNDTNPGAFMSGLSQPYGPTALQSAKNLDTVNPTPYGWVAGMDGSNYFTGNPPLPLIYVYRIDNPGSLVPTMTRFDLPISPVLDQGTTPPLNRVSVKGGLKGTNSGVLDLGNVNHIRDNILWVVTALPVDQFGDSNPANPNIDRLGVRWFSIDVSTAMPFILDSGTLWDPAANNPNWYWYPQMISSPIDENGQSHMLLSASSGGKNSFWNEVIWTGTTNANNRGVLSITQTTPITVTQGNTPWNPTQDFLGSNKVYRDGDYHQASVDPVDGSLWTTGEFAYDPINWGVSLVHVTFDQPCN